MGELSYNSALLTRYLLGDLSQDEQDHLEEAYFSNNELFIGLLDAKDQLTSEYLGGRLAAVDRERYERRYLALPDCRQEIELDRFLQSASVRNPLTTQSVPRWWQAVFIALRAHLPLAGVAITALLILGATGLWSVLHHPSQQNPGNLGESNPSASAGPITVSLALTPVRLRSHQEETPKAVVGTSTQVVELQLEVGSENYVRYQASLQSLDERNTKVLADSALKADPTAGKPLTVTWKLPATKLPIGDYQVKLSGISTDNSTNYIGDYDFKVRNQ